MTDEPVTRSGFVGILGRPNVGKSTLMNHMLGQKLSITSRKPQTTRYQLLGIHTVERDQMVFVDTPGLHTEEPRALNRYMNREATTALRDVDVVVFVVDRDLWNEGDANVLERFSHLQCPVLAVINKVDQMADTDQLLPHIEWLSQQYPFTEIVPVSALRSRNLDRLESAIRSHLPEGPHHFGDDDLTNRSSRFLAAEMIREKITRQLGAELPYTMAVEIETFEQEGNTLHINGLILVERQGQKKIVIGDKGSRLRQIGQESRLDMESLFGSKVMLRLWVKVRKGWADDERALRSLGYGDQGR